MQRIFLFLFLLVALLTTSSQEAFAISWDLGNGSHRIYVGPEVYYVKRLREGGSKQNGWAVGGRFGYDHIRRYTFYFGLEGVYAKGQLKGESTSAKVRSNLKDAEIEGRFGYTFQTKCGWNQCCHHHALYCCPQLE